MYFIIILIILITILTILYKGIKIRIKYKINDNIKLNIKINIFKIKIFQKTIPKNKTLEKQKTPPNTKNIINIIKKYKKEIILLLKTLKKSINIIQFKNHIKIGLDDYVKTVEIIGYLWSINTILNINDKHNLTAESDFNNQTIQINGQILFNINILKFIIHILTNKNLRIFIKKIIGEYKN